MTELLYGKPVATHIKDRVTKEINQLYKTPKLATILVGNHESSEKYVSMKEKAASKLGIETRSIKLDENETTQYELNSIISKLNNDDSIDGILLQHPIPDHLNEREAFDQINPDKDVDGVTSINFGEMAMGLGSFLACTPAAILEILDFYNIYLEGKNVKVIGRSPVLGKPIAAKLINKNATVTICHSYTKNLEKVLSEGDIIIAAMGKPNFIKGNWLKDGVVVIDAGYNEGNIGDVEFDSCLPVSSAITPVPKGVGPVTIAKLLENTVISAKNNEA